ncbi:NAD-dependent epimerase/dehydratase family protein [Oceanispirochaeta crateris]|uniref:NAD-dependent epimerase/dehydratase family protein n=1 Tax=Oceanispirochaeta crateris TaxID=2518645 RepID=A0A5C1QMB0_9SPIO|nr:NAD-dependent epimerase/dehydratase family protein [Oceanispirochaeta crateris]QEN08637.1 NAD-dependent epimerase/dehydratase family protein [Oceanispirochaeta crateris]
MKNILITGGAGFVGFHLSRHSGLNDYDRVVLVDNLNSYYDPSLKYGRLKELGFLVDESTPEMTAVENEKGWVFYRADLKNRDQMETLFKEYPFDHVVHLGAQAGVRYSIENPESYVDSNLVGFVNILECCRHHPVKHLVYASSSSVYGANTKVPFHEDDPVTKPISLYAATKRSNELLAYSYSHLYGIPTTGLRFFTVYGPWGRPDMAYFLFAEKIIKGKTIQVFNQGDMKRDFTYVDDITESITRLIEKPMAGKDEDPARILNIGHGSPVDLSEFIRIIEENLGMKAQKEYLPMQDGDVPMTWADTSRLEELTGYSPKVTLREGIEQFALWYKEYRNL